MLLAQVLNLCSKTSWLAPWEGAVRAYRAGIVLSGSCMYLHSRVFEFKDWQRDLKSNSLALNDLFSEIMTPVWCIKEANRLKIFEGTKWKRPFIIAQVSLLLFNSLFLYKTRFNQSLPSSLEGASNVSWRFSYLIKAIISVVFAIFEYRHRPKETCMYFLGGTMRTAMFVFNSEIADKVQSIINKSLNGMIFCVGDRSEKALIALVYLFEALHAYKYPSKN